MHCAKIHQTFLSSISELIRVEDLTTTSVMSLTSYMVCGLGYSSAPFSVTTVQFPLRQHNSTLIEVLKVQTELSKFALHWRGTLQTPSRVRSMTKSETESTITIAIRTSISHTASGVLRHEVIDYLPPTTGALVVDVVERIAIQ
ncbi:hypothetical protein J6590_057634 [Homalodisca vitripennis]|nr:hypothetical protein J6590_057634 [Homalodisca vitripennis]